MDIRPIEDNSNKVVALYHEGKIDEETMKDTLEAIDATALKITESKVTPAAIPFPYEKVKAYVENDLGKYTNMVVTEENLASSEKIQRALGGLAKKFDQYRIDKKKEASSEITVFEDQVNEIKKMVLDVQTGIKNQTSIFEQNRKEERMKKIEEWIHEIASDLGLSEKYESMLTIDEKYLNKTAKDKDVKNDLLNRGNSLLELQKQEEQPESIRTQKKEMAEKLCVNASNQSELTTPISVSDLGNLDDVELVDIVNLVSEKVKERKSLEEKAKATISIPRPMEKVEEKMVEPSETDDFYWYEYRIKFNKEQKEKFDFWLKDRGIDYEILS